MSVDRTVSYMVEQRPSRVERHSRLEEYWPAVFDPLCQFPYVFGTPRPEAVSTAMSLWDENLSLDDGQRFRDVVAGQQVREYLPWQPLFRFDSQPQEMFVVVDGTYLRTWIRARGNEVVALSPLFQPLRKGFIASPTTFYPSTNGVLDRSEEPEDPEALRTLEMVFCIRRGHVLHINNPLEILKIDEISKSIARCRDRDMRWLQDRMFDLQTNEERIKSLMQSLAGLKDTIQHSKDQFLFKSPFSQSALAECLGMPDNTLRPHLKNIRFEWTAGKLLLHADFIKLAKLEVLTV